LIGLAKKFEPIEEIFAVYLDMLFLPLSVRETVADKIEHALTKRNWHKEYIAFAKACDTCQVNTPIGAAIQISELVCRFLEHVDINATSMIETVTEYIQIIWQIIKKDEEGTLTQ
jgi:hypothetical protein